ncbi:hypothetical protein PAECIP111893_01167 [Paenibacillus plantiphilus]|uniref:Uncharacterized protein n=1 Tax=Paenibacillus plantiphilus TaxID=2905650 RepID=A0ABM9C1G3_9BACL|nr:hypothetical protein [Paenibacillus plantiphilus]CAH1198917.1 hypothetical protein PAECIP111893_01167 [Paenibacillus plantiphilus]
MIDFLYHYYDESTGPFLNLSDLELEEAERVLQDIRIQKKGFASQRSADYLTIRRGLEWRARELFILKGGRPVRRYPHYMTVGECAWLLEWFENGRELRIPAAAFDPYSISFTYGDLFPTMRYEDGKVYRGQVYTLDEIGRVINRFGLPQQWNPQGDHGPERYVEVQIWADDVHQL